MDVYRYKFALNGCQMHIRLCRNQEQTPVDHKKKKRIKRFHESIWTNLAKEKHSLIHFTPRSFIRLLTFSLIYTIITISSTTPRPLYYHHILPPLSHNSPLPIGNFTSTYLLLSSLLLSSSMLPVEHSFPRLT